MYELTLLERIQELEKEKKADGPAPTPAEVEMQSIMTHLSKLLNTNRGSVQIDPDYGMPEMSTFSHSGLDETMKNIQSAMQQLVRRYEKRLSRVKINIEPDKSDVLTIHFSLEAVLARHEDVPVFFHSLVKPGGRVNVKK